MNLNPFSERYTSLLLTGFPALARMARERARETMMRSSFVRSLNGLASSSGGTSAMGSAVSPLVAAASTDAAATTGSGSGSSSASGAAVCPWPATGNPTLARMARERARETMMRSSFVRSLNGLASSSGGTSAIGSVTTSALAAAGGGPRGPSAGARRRGGCLFSAGSRPCALCLAGHWYASLGAHGVRAGSRYQDAFLFGEFLKRLVEQFDWHFYLRWSCLYGSRLHRGCGCCSLSGRSLPRCCFGCRGCGFCCQLRRWPNQLLRFFGNLIEGTRANFVLEFQKGFQQGFRAWWTPRNIDVNRHN